MCRRCSNRNYWNEFLQTGKTAEVIWMYEQSVALNPQNESGIHTLKRLKGK